MDVYLNGDLVSLKSQTPTFETDDFYFFESSNHYDYLKVMNLGVLVDDFPGRRGLFHIKGDIVTKKHLTLNTSRNQVLQHCMVWPKILEDIKQLRPAPKKIETLSDDEIRVLIFDSFLGNISFKEIFKSKIFPSYNSRKRFSLYEIATSEKLFAFYYGGVDPNDNILADKITQKGIGFILSPKLFVDTIISPEEFVNDYFERLRSYLLQNPSRYSHVLNKIKPYHELVSMVIDAHNSNAGIYRCF